MIHDEDVAVEKISVLAKADGTAIQIKTSTIAGDEIHLIIGAVEARNLLGLLLAAMEHLTPDKQFTPSNDSPVPTSQFEAGEAFTTRERDA